MPARVARGELRPLGDPNSLLDEQVQGPYLVKPFRC